MKQNPKQEIAYSEIKVGQTVSKSGAFPSGKVVEIKKTGRLVELVLDNGDNWFGFEDRLINIEDN